MINIVVETGSRRLTYICEVIFSYVLKTPYRIYEKKLFQSFNEKGKISIDDPLIIYCDDFQYDGLRIPNSGFIWEEQIRQFEPAIKIDDFIKLFPSVSTQYNIDFDLFSVSFYLITEYESWFISERDIHNRVDETKTFVYRNKLHHFPLVNIYARFLTLELKRKYPQFEIPLSVFNYEFTIDVDHAWAFLNKGIIGLFGFIKDLIKFDFQNFRHRLDAFLTKSDPYENFDFITEIVDNQHCTFFIPVTRLSKLDTRFTLGNKAYLQLIRKISGKEYQIGVHPSYHSFNNTQAIKSEFGLLDEMCKQKISNIRQHFLRISYPGTRKSYEKIGIFNDYNSVMINDFGFKNGICCSFPWFDLSENRMSRLKIHPSCAMDVTLKNYLGLSVSEAESSLNNLAQIIYKYGGTFRVVWHNNSLSEIHGWKGWRNVFVNLNKELESMIIKK